MWSSNTYSRCLLSRKISGAGIEWVLFIYGSRAAAYCHDGADGGVAASARRFANGFFLKQEIVSSSRRRCRHAMCLVALRLLKTVSTAVMISADCLIGWAVGPFFLRWKINAFTWFSPLHTSFFPRGHFSHMTTNHNHRQFIFCRTAQGRPFSAILPWRGLRSWY